MRVLISESQLNDLISIIEDNEYHNYDNVSDAQKQSFYRNKAGYISTPKKEKKKPFDYFVVIMHWSGDINKRESWKDATGPLPYPFAKNWIKTNVINPKKYKIEGRYYK